MIRNKKRYVFFVISLLITHHFLFVLVPAFIGWDKFWMWDMGLWSGEKRSFYLVTTIFAPIIALMIELSMKNDCRWRSNKNT